MCAIRRAVNMNMKKVLMVVGCCSHWWLCLHVVLCSGSCSWQPPLAHSLLLRLWSNFVSSVKVTQWIGMLSLKNLQKESLRFFSNKSGRWASLYANVIWLTIVLNCPILTDLRSPTPSFQFTVIMFWPVLNFLIDNVASLFVREMGECFEFISVK